jgi:hypothetical protein
MYYIPSYTPTKKGIDINKKRLVDEDSNEIFTFCHGTEKGYYSRKPLLIDFEYTINEDDEIVITDEVAAVLIAKYKGSTFKVFETAASRERGRNMTGLMAWSSVLGDHGDTSGIFSNHETDK